MRRPRIGITMDGDGASGRHALNMSYVRAVTRGGGVALPLAYSSGSESSAELIETLDGLLFTGGDDLDPARYGQPRHRQAVPVDPERERFEFALMSQARRRNLPTLCICLGFQLMNVHYGGSLIQFLPEYPREHPLEHRRLELPSRRHGVRLEGDSLIGRSLGKTALDVNTSHKQGIDRVGDGLRVSAVAPDGIIEGLEDPSLPFFIGVQWHPERLADEADHLALFTLLADQCRRCQ